MAKTPIQSGICTHQLWAMINELHEQLRQAGVIVFGLKGLDEHVPALGARAATSTATRTKSGPGTTKPVEGGSP